MMMPGLGKINPKQMQAMMKQMGINQVDIPADRVIIEKSDGRIVIDNPNVQKITMQGQESFQVTGDVSEESGINEEDIRLVMEKTGKSKAEVTKVLEKTNDIAEAILQLSE
jgi:nascent polypeptide-associated complex subunit alpha